MSVDPASRFPDAPAEVLAVANAIAAGEVPGPDALAALPDGAINASWWAPAARDKPDFGHPLLREAVLARNIDAARALIDAGANPRFNNGELPFLAGHLVDPDQRRLWFPDYSAGIAFLDLWLALDGSPNAQSPWDGTPLLSDLPHNNLEATLYLLSRGADPWASPVTSVSDSGFEFRGTPYFLARANANPISVETSFRIARQEGYQGGPADVIDDLTARYERTAEQFNTVSGPSGLHTVWMLQKTLPLIYQQIDRDPGPEVAQLLAIEVPADIGGFWLGPDDIRSPDVEGQRPLEDNQTGQERWDDM